MNFYEILEKQTKAYPGKPAIIFKETAITFSELRKTAFSLANGLNALGLRKGEKAAIYMPNNPEYMYSFLGIFLLHGVCVPLDFMLTEEEIINFLNHSETKILIAHGKKGVDFDTIKSRCPLLQKIVLLGVEAKEGFISWSTVLTASASVLKKEAEEGDHSAIFYTSGSTGHPKGVLLTYRHLDTPVKCMDHFLHPHDNDILLCAGVPFSHIGGLDYMLLSLYFGQTLVLMERFHPLEFLKYIEKYKATIFCIVPSMYVAILSLKEYNKFDLSSLRHAVVFGAPSSPVLLKRFHKACPNAFLLNGWGMTETAAPNCFLPTGTDTKAIEDAGRFPPEMQAKIADDDGISLGPEEEGELWVKGEGVMVGYYKEPVLTRSVITQDGWLKTGDIAKFDKENRFYIVGRKKDMIKVAGEIVFSPEVEEVIQRYPKVKEVAVIGVPDAMRGEVPKALLVVKEGENLTEEELRYFLRGHLAHFKIPHHFEFCASLPKNRVGKIDKEKLKQTLPAPA
ncbi:MAG: class I adenylate-forming enzyme family protein [Candidatus Omnitrophota bacterium]|jgi:acyl-CoA synthetase (AMP-forming)/AMP-acid ligase II